MLGVQHWSFSMPQLCQIAIDLHVNFIFHVRTASRTVYSHIYVCKT
jgi:hypothetical protein